MRKAVEEAEAAKREATAWMWTWSDRNSSGALIIRMGYNITELQSVGGLAG